MIFTIDYVARIATVHAMSRDKDFVEHSGDFGPLELTRIYAFQWLNIIDFLAIAPFYFQLCFGDVGISSAASVLRVLRLIRVFRVLKMPQLSTCVNMFVAIIQDSMPAIFLLFFLTLVTSVLIASCIVFAEGSDYSVDRFPDTHPQGVYVRPTYDGYGWEPTPFKSIPSAFWWFFTTATTVGFGDYYPTTGLGRVIGTMTFYLGIVLLALPITIIGGHFGRHYSAWLKEIEALSKPKTKAVRGSANAANEISSVQVRPVSDFATSAADEENGINALRCTPSTGAAIKPGQATQEEKDHEERGMRLASMASMEEDWKATGQPAASGQEPLRKAAAAVVAEAKRCNSPSEVRVAWS